MANDSNNNEENPISAEAVYAHYQRNRAVDAQKHNSDTKSDTNVNSAIDLLTEDDTAFAENIYRHYQATRTSDAQASVDTIMRKVHEQSITHVVSQEEQPPAMQDTPQIHAIDAKPVSASVSSVSVDEQSQVDTPAANSPSNSNEHRVKPGKFASNLTDRIE